MVLVCCEFNVFEVIKVVENLDDLTLGVLDSDIKGVHFLERLRKERKKGGIDGCHFYTLAEIQFF